MVVYTYYCVAELYLVSENNIPLDRNRVFWESRSKHTGHFMEYVSLYIDGKDVIWPIFKGTQIAIKIKRWKRETKISCLQYFTKNSVNQEDSAKSSHISLPHNFCPISSKNCLICTGRGTCGMYTCKK